MIPAFGIRLRKQDCKCDFGTIYMDMIPVVQRARGLSDSDWDTLCRYICGEVPTEYQLQERPVADDPAAWDRLDVFMAPHETLQRGAVSKKRRK